MSDEKDPQGFDEENQQSEQHSARPSEQQSAQPSEQQSEEPSDQLSAQGGEPELVSDTAIGAEDPNFDLDGTIAELKSQLEKEPDKFARKSPPVNPVGVMMNMLSLFMFVGGALLSLMLVARSFELHGTVLVGFVVVSCAVVLGMAGSLLCKILGDVERWLAGAVLGACFGALSALIIYGQTRNYSWWQ